MVTLNNYLALAIITFSTMQEPIRVCLGERREWKGSGAKRRIVLKKDEMMYVPILHTLQSLLNHDSVYSEVSKVKLYILINVDYIINFVSIDKAWSSV